MAAREAKRSIRSLRAEGYRRRTLSTDASAPLASLSEEVAGSTLPLLDAEAAMRRRTSVGEDEEPAPDGRRLWRQARTRLGLAPVDRLDGRVNVESTGQGPVQPPQLTREPSTLASMFVDRIAGGGLGTVAAAAEAESQAPPGLWAPASDAKVRAGAAGRSMRTRAP